MTVLEVLQKAREEYERCGVNRGPRLSLGEVCAAIAMARATGYDDQLFAEARTAFLVANGESGSTGSVPQFNDTHTRQEVLEAFSKAIEYEVGRG